MRQTGDLSAIDARGVISRKNVRRSAIALGAILAAFAGGFPASAQVGPAGSNGTSTVPDGGNGGVYHTLPSATAVVVGGPLAGGEGGTGYTFGPADAGDTSTTSGMDGTVSLAGQAGIAAGDSFDLNVNGTTTTVTINAADTLEDIAAKISAIAGVTATATTTGTNDTLTIAATSLNNQLILFNNNNTPLTALGFGIIPRTLGPISTPGGNGGNGGIALDGPNDIPQFVNHSTISGGSGGNGGTTEYSLTPTKGGDGGHGGAAVRYSGNASITLTNNGVIAGGDGGSAGAGSGGGAAGTNGLGGQGIIITSASPATIINSGTISGGLGGDGATRALAIDMSGTGNRLVLQTGSSLIGNVVLGTAGGTLALEGSGSEDARFSGISTVETETGADWTLAGDLVLPLGGAMLFDTGGSSTLSISGTIDAGGLVKSGTGTLILSGSNAYGDTTVTAGTLIGDVNSISGNIANAGTVTFNQATNGVFAGSIAGYGGTDGSMLKSGAGTLTLTGTSSLHWSISSGRLVTSAERFSGNAAIASGAQLTLKDEADVAYSGVLSGTGRFTKDGAGKLLLSGDSSGFSGTTTVLGGILAVGGTDGQGKLGGSFSIASGARLQGAGRVGAVALGDGATLAPGNSIGTLTVAGDLTFAAGSTYEVETDPGGTGSDLVHVLGTAHLNGASVAHIGMDGSYRPFSTYTILTADGGIDGTFGGVTSVYAFLTPVLDYDAGNVYLELQRNQTDFADRARTRNQIATASGVESLGSGSEVYLAVASLPNDDAQIGGAFDALSGEIHASLKSALIEESHFVRDAVGARLRSAFSGIAAPAMPLIAYGPDGPRPAAADGLGLTAWGQAFGAWGEANGDGNAARLERSTGGFLTGLDGAIAPDVRLGLLAGYSHSSLDADGRASSASSDNVHLGLYGGGRWKALRLNGGLAYTWHDIETGRSPAFNGFSDTLSASYDAGTFQVFGEAGYRIETAAATFEPFAGLAYVNLDTDGFGEAGGAAALGASGATTDTTFATLGLHAATRFALGEMTARAHGTLAWRHAFGDTVPLSSQAFAGSDAFTVAGTPIAEDAALIEAGLDLAITDSATLGLSYAGQIASDAREHGFNASITVRF